MNIKLDFLGNQIDVGDRVVFMKPNYRELARGTVIKLNDKKLTIEYTVNNTSRTFMQFYEQVVKI